MSVEPTAPHEAAHAPMPPIVHLLEKIDNFFHVVVGFYSCLWRRRCWCIPALHLSGKSPTSSPKSARRRSP